MTRSPIPAAHGDPIRPTPQETDAATPSQLGGVGSNPGMHPNTGHESAGAAGNDAGGDIPVAAGHTFIDRRNSLMESAGCMSGGEGVRKMRLRTSEALHTALAAELQGRV
ncbi:MAG: hypothetical protein ACPG4X_21535 [Pikeienuella sp.]